MKLHLPLSLRFALLAACALVGISHTAGARDAYWVDARGQRHDIAQRVASFDVENADSFILQDCDSTVRDRNNYTGGAFVFGEVYDEEHGQITHSFSSATITAKNVSITGNLCASLSDEYCGYAEGGAFVLNLIDSKDVNEWDNVPELGYFSFANCGEVTITNNGVYGQHSGSHGGSYPTAYDETITSHGSGGAIHVTGNYGPWQQKVRTRSVLEFKNNEHVLFRGNYTTTGSLYYLNAISAMDADLAFAAAGGKKIECYDGMLIAGTLWINTTHPELRSEQDKAFTGTVILSGKYAGADIAQVKGSAATEQELYHSRRIETEAVYVERGVLEIRDNMELAAVRDTAIQGTIKGGIYMASPDCKYFFQSTAQAEVRMSNAVLHTEVGDCNSWWYSYHSETPSPVQYGTVVMPRASFTGHNVIRANYLNTEKGTWTFHVGAENRSAALVSLVFDDVHEYDDIFQNTARGFFTAGATFNISVEDGLEYGVYKLLELNSYLCEWNGMEDVTLTGVVSGSIGVDSGDVFCTTGLSGMLTLWFDYSGGASGTAVWVDAQGQQHEIAQRVPTLNIHDADAFVLKDNRMNVTDVYGGAVFLGGEDSEGRETVTARAVTISGNKSTLLDPDNYGYYIAGGALVVDLLSSDGIENFDPEMRYLSFSGCGEVSITDNGASAGTYHFVDDMGQSNWGKMHALGGALEVEGNQGLWQEPVDGEHQGKMLERRSALEFKNNDRVYIRGNYVNTNDLYYLNAIETDEADLAFAAGAGQTVECFDSLLVDGTLWINTTHPLLRDGSESSYTGTVTLSGEHAVEDLTKLKGGKAPTAEELQFSRRVYTEAVHVEHGVLELKEVEIYSQYDMYDVATKHESLFYSSADAEVHMTNATLHTEWGYLNSYWDFPHAGKEYAKQYGTVILPRASFTGHNVIRANYINAEKGTWTFYVGAENRSAALVSLVFDDVHEYDDAISNTLRGLYTAGSTFSIKVAKGLASGTYKLLEFDSSLSEWLGLNEVTLSGASDGGISKDRGEVYYTIGADEVLTLWFDYDGSADSDSTYDPTPEEPTSMLNKNQKAVLRALLAAAQSGQIGGELEVAVAEALAAAETNPAAAMALLDKLSGAELATAMTSQLVGNLAHLRRLRANMGSGYSIDSTGKSAVYFVGYDEQHSVDENEDGRGIKRSEWGGMLGYERSVSENTLLGVALTSGSADVDPTNAESYSEDAVRVDLYCVVNFGSAWQSVTSIGYGVHSFDTTRTLPNAMSAKASMDGTSINFMQELSYTIRTSEKNSWQPFAAVELSANSIDAFTESGAGTASLAGGSRSATAADITLGARYIHSFAMGGRQGSVHAQAGVVASAGDTAADLELHFTGAPGQKYTVSSAGYDGVGFNIGGGVELPVSKSASVTGSLNAILRSGAEEYGASVGLRLSF